MNGKKDKIVTAEEIIDLINYLIKINDIEKLNKLSKTLLCNIKDHLVNIKSDLRNMYLINVWLKMCMQINKLSLDRSYSIYNDFILEICKINEFTCYEVECLKDLKTFCLKMNKNNDYNFLAVGWGLFVTLITFDDILNDVYDQSFRSWELGIKNLNCIQVDDKSEALKSLQHTIEFGRNYIKKTVD